MKQLTQPPVISSPTRTENRVDALLALRGLACLMVVIAHCNPPRSFLVYHTLDLSWLLFSAGGVAVRIFFCLSGYLMGKAFYTQRYTLDFSGILNFWHNRALRVLPLYYFSIAISGLLVYTEIWKPENWSALLKILTFTYDQTLPIAFNGALWTLSTEIQFYLSVPLIFLCLKNHLRHPRQIGKFALGLSLGFLILRYMVWMGIKAQVPPPEQAIAFVRYIYVPLWMNLDVFLGGLLLNFCIQTDPKTLLNDTPILSKSIRFWRQISRSLLKPLKFPLSRINPKTGLQSMAVVLLLMLYTGTAYLKYYHQELLGLISPTLTLCITAFFIYAFEKRMELPNPNFRHRPLSLAACQDNPWRLLEVLGLLSYGIYVWHLPILAKIQPLFISEIPIEAYLSCFGATLSLSVFFATITYYIIELPTANLKKIKSPSSIQKS